MNNSFDRDSEMMAADLYHRVQQGGRQPLVCIACGSTIHQGSSCQCGGAAVYGVDVHLVLPVLEAAALASLAKQAIQAGSSSGGHAERISIAARKLSDTLLSAGVYVSS